MSNMTTPSNPLLTRYDVLDAMRFDAAIAIIWLHTFGGGQWAAWGFVGRYAVPFFSASAVYLIFKSVDRNPSKPFTDYALSRVSRLYVPFILWTAIYCLAMAAGNIVKGMPIAPLSIELYLSGDALYHSTPRAGFPPR